MGGIFERELTHRVRGSKRARGKNGVPVEVLEAGACRS